MLLCGQQMYVHTIREEVVFLEMMSNFPVNTNLNWTYKADCEDISIRFRKLFLECCYFRVR